MSRGGSAGGRAATGVVTGGIEEKKGKRSRQTNKVTKCILRAEYYS